MPLCRFATSPLKGAKKLVLLEELHLIAEFAPPARGRVPGGRGDLADWSNMNHGNLFFSRILNR
jgi:hypothetical protein